MVTLVIKIVDLEKFELLVIFGHQNVQYFKVKNLNQVFHLFIDHALTRESIKHFFSDNIHAKLFFNI